MASARGDLVPGVPVEAGAGNQFGEAALGLVDGAGDQGDGSEVIAGQPGAATLSERGQGVVDEVEGIVAAVRAGLVVTIDPCRVARLPDPGSGGQLRLWRS